MVSLKIPATWSSGLVTAGYIAVLIGAIDPMEGSLLILAGSGLIALGTYTGGGAGWLLAYRAWSLALVLSGVAALWGLSVAGGFGGASGRSMAWGLLVLPYLVGWLMTILGSGAPRWVPWLGLGVGLWYLALAAMLAKDAPQLDESASVAIVLGAVGIAAITGCAYRLKHQAAARSG